MHNAASDLIFNDTVLTFSPDLILQSINISVLNNELFEGDEFSWLYLYHTYYHYYYYSDYMDILLVDDDGKDFHTTR